MGQKYIKWTTEMLREEALKYTTRRAFESGSNSAYQTAQRRGILDEICAHAKPVRTYWTNEMLAEEAKNYRTRSEFSKGSVGAYGAAIDRGILDDICTFMEQPYTRWTDEMVEEEALKYTTRIAFQKGSPNAYATARRRGNLDNVCRHTEQVRTYWTNEMLAKEAKKYKTRKAFEKGSRGAYDASRRRKIFEEICAHMPKNVGTNYDLPCRLYWYLHPEGYCYIGITNDESNRHIQHHANRHNDWVKWIVEQCEPECYTWYVEHSGKFEIMEHARKVVERMERMFIRKAVISGLKCVNKDHNPQWDARSGTYSWEADLKLST